MHAGATVRALGLELRLAILAAAAGIGLAAAATPNSGAIMAQECPLSAPLTLKDTQGGVVGETGTIWTIAPDCSFSIARQLGYKALEPHKRGHLTPDQQANLGNLLSKLEKSELPARLGAAPQVNARRITVSYGQKEAVLVLAPGGGDLGTLRASSDDGRARDVLDLAAAVKAMLGN